MLVGRLLFDNDELGRLRWRAAEFIRCMIKARARIEPGFMSVADYERWELDGLSRKEQDVERLLQCALQLIREVNERWLERCGSGGMRLDVADPLQNLKELVGFFTDYQWALPEAIRSVIAGRPVNWSELARWDDLPAIRGELDKLPRLDDHLRAAPGGPDLAVPITPTGVTSSDAAMTISYHGLQGYSTNGAPVSVTEEEHKVLQAFVLNQTSMTRSELEAAANITNAPRVLTQLEERYGGIFAPAIRRPGRKGKGGYYVRVIRCDQHGEAST